MSTDLKTEATNEVKTVEAAVSKVGDSTVTIKKYVLAAVGLALLIVGFLLGKL
jgi:hypothetical protein